MKEPFAKAGLLAAKIILERPVGPSSVWLTPTASLSSFEAHSLQNIALDWNRNKYPKFKAMFLRKQKLAGRNKAVRLVPDRYAFRLNPA